MIAKGLELEKDIYPGEICQVKPGYEQSERVVAMLTPNAEGRAALEAIDVQAISTEGGVVAVQPGTGEPFASFGKSLELPKRVQSEIAAQEEASKAMEETVEERPVGEVPTKTPITSQLLDEDEKTNLLESSPPVVAELTDEFAEFSRRNGGSRLKYVSQMTNVGALRAALASLKSESKTAVAINARIAEISGVPEQLS
jgi:hypothetical protein